MVGTGTALLVSGLASAGVGVGSAIASGSMNKKTREWQAKQNQIERNRQDTAWQRTVQDMAKAGLNPVAMNGTAGADTSGASLDAQGYSPDMSGIAQGITSAMEGISKKDEVELNRAKFESEKANAEANVEIARANSDIARGQAEETARSNKAQEELSKISQEEAGRHNLASEEIQRNNADFKNRIANEIITRVSKGGNEPTKEGTKKQLESAMEKIGIDKEEVYKEARKKAVKKQGRGKNNYHSQKDFYDKLPKY